MRRERECRGEGGQAMAEGGGTEASTIEGQAASLLLPAGSSAGWVYPLAASWGHPSVGPSSPPPDVKGLPSPPPLCRTTSLATEEVILEGLVLTEELLGGISAAFPHTHKLRFHCCVAQVEGRGGGEEGGEGMGSERAMSGEEGRGEDRIRGGR